MYLSTQKAIQKNACLARLSIISSATSFAEIYQKNPFLFYLAIQFSDQQGQAVEGRQEDSRVSGVILRSRLLFNHRKNRLNHANEHVCIPLSTSLLLLVPKDFIFGFSIYLTIY